MDRSRGVKECLTGRSFQPVLATALLLAFPQALGAETFSSQRAFSHVRHLAETIGPRKTGTPGEARAREYVAEELRRLGLPVTRQSVPRQGGAMVGSENIVGVLKGDRPDAILIAAHHDTRSASVPGANDDASGVGVMLEAARVLAASRPGATLLFASFCAEEEGLLGSRYFAATEDLSRLCAVLNLDPVGQNEVFISPFPTAPPLWANRALAKVAREDGIPGIIHDPLYLLVSRSVLIPYGADHEPFQSRGVPALSLSSRFDTWTYHTSEDLAEHVQRESLEWAGRAVLGLVRRFDEAPPRQVGMKEDPTYVVVSLAGRPVFIVTGAILVLAALVPVLALLWWRTVWDKARRRGRRLTSADAVRGLGRCAIPLGCLVAGGMFSEGAAEVVTGFRFSWLGSQRLHLGMALCWSAAGLAAGWLVLRRSSGWGAAAPEELETYTVLSAASCGAIGCLSLLAGRPDVGFYFLLPAAATLAGSSAAPKLAGVGTLAGYLPMLGLVTPSNYRDAVTIVSLSVPAWIAAPAIFLVAMPLALGLARTLAPPAGRRAPWLLLAGGAAAGLVLLVAVRSGSGYDAMNRRVVRVTQRVDLAKPESSGEVVIASDEYLRRVTTNLPELPLLDARATSHRLSMKVPEEMRRRSEPHILIRPVTSPLEAGCSAAVRELSFLVFPPRPADRARFVVRSAEPLRVLDDGAWIAKQEISRRHVSADDAPSDTLRLCGAPGQEIEIEVRVEMAEDILGLQLSADQVVVRWLSLLTWTGTRVL